MGYVLLWIENLAVSLLLVATVIASISRLRPDHMPWLPRSVKGLVSILLALALLTVYTGLTTLAGWLYFANIAISGQFPALLLLTVAYAGGAVWLLVRGLRYQTGQPNVVGAGWPCGKLAVALLGVIALHMMTFWNLDIAARQQLATLGTEAGAMALSVAPPRLPDRDNAAVVYRQAFEAMGGRYNEYCRDSWRWEKQWETAWEKIWTRRQQSGNINFDLHDPELRRFLKRQSPTLALLREAAAKPGCCFDREYGRPSIAMSLPEVGPLRTGARLLALNAICRAADGDHRGAIEDINAMFLIAEHVGSDPIPVCTLVAIIVDNLATETLQIVLASGHVSVEDLAMLKISNSLSYRTLLRRDIRMDEAFGLATFDQVGGNPLKLMLCFGGSNNWTRFRSWCFAPIYRIFLLSDDLAAKDWLTRELNNIAKASGPYDQIRRATQTYDSHLRNEPGEVLANVLVPWLASLSQPVKERELYPSEEEKYDQHSRNRPNGILATALMPVMTSFVTAMVEGEARRDIARLGTVLYRYHARNGRFPEKLHDLAPDFIPVVPLDPFDGKPMRLKRTKDKLIVYSVGPDLADNGGTPFDQKEQTGDIAFELPDRTP